jgi:hypothetical protein
MHLREFKVDTMIARRAPSSPQAVAQTLSVIHALYSFIAPYLPKWSITFVPLLLTYYLWAITLKESLSPPGSFCEPLSPLTGRQRLFQPEPSLCVDQSDRVPLAVERILRNRLLGAAERRGVASASLLDAAVGLFVDAS